MKKIIGFAGQISSGKDLCADIAAADLIAFGEKWARASFAAPLKALFADTFGLSLDFVEKWKRVAEPPPGFHMSVRQCLQAIGDGFRKMKSDVWMELAFARDENSILSDVRYVNEARAIKARGGVVILVWRPGYENNDPHPSEAELKSIIDWFVASGMEGDVRGSDFDEDEDMAAKLSLFDFFIRNEGTIEDLRQKVAAILSSIDKARPTTKKGAACMR